MTEKVKFNKLQVAINQTDSAIELFFQDKLIPAHTLVMAAHEVIGVLVKNKGGETFHETFLKQVRPERLNDFKKNYSSEYNFFKHADRDFDKEIEFDSFQTEYTFLSILSSFKEYFPELITKNMEAFILWSMIYRKDYYADGTQKEIENIKIGLENFLNLSKHDFFLSFKRMTTL